MCLAVPAKILSIQDALAKVELSGVTKDVCSCMRALPCRSLMKKKPRRRMRCSTR